MDEFGAYLDERKGEILELLYVLKFSAHASFFLFERDILLNAVFRL